MSGKKKERRYEINPNTGCWNWLLYKDRKGYGRVQINGKSTPAHRYYYEKHKGPIPEGYQIDHVCKNTSCVNPHHLEAVTGRENLRRAGAIKLSHPDIIGIKKALAYGAPIREVAKQFNTFYNTVFCIAHGITHADIS